MELGCKIVLCGFQIPLHETGAKKICGFGLAGECGWTGKAAKKKQSYKILLGNLRNFAELKNISNEWSFNFFTNEM